MGNAKVSGMTLNKNTTIRSVYHEKFLNLASIMRNCLYARFVLLRQRSLLSKTMSSKTLLS